jgi:flagellar basal body-associated protein FliL
MFYFLIFYKYYILQNIIGDESMKKILLIPLVMLIILLNTTIVHSAPFLSSKDLVSIYSETLDFLVMGASNSKVKNYIAIDMSSKPLKNLSASEKLQILNYMEKYNTSRVNVIAASLEDLNSRGLLQEKNNQYFNGLGGLLLKVTDIETAPDNKVVVVGSWYSPAASTENIRVTLEKENGQWIVKKSS